MPRKKKTTEPEVKVSKSQQDEFPYSGFPVKIIHKDGKELKDTKTCYFQSKDHADKYIKRCKFKKTDYKMICRDDVS